MLQPPKMREILKDVCRGMAYLNGFKPPILHRDLKPANLLVTKTLQVKICDFGLSVQKSIEGARAPWKILREPVLFLPAAQSGLSGALGVPDGDGGDGDGVGAADEDLGGTGSHKENSFLKKQN